MQDVAKMGFQVDTSSLDKATASLDRMKAAASGLATSTSSTEMVISKASVQVAAAKTAEAREILSAMRASETATTSDIKMAVQSLKTARAAETKARSLLAAASAAQSLDAAQKAAAASTTNLFNKMSTSRSHIQPSATGLRFGSPADAPIPRDQMPNRFNTANIAAQFQDIGVTASMGMSPIIVALQQGTQLSAIINSMESPLKGIADAFKSIINPVSLLSIALTGLAVVLIQNIDWIKLAQSILNGFASALDFVAASVTYVADGLAVLAIAAGTVGAAFLAYKAITLALTIQYSALATAALASAGSMISSAVAASAAWVLAAVRTLMSLTALKAGFLTMAATAVTATATMVRAAGAATLAWLAALGPIGWITIAIGTLSAAVLVFREDLKNILGFDVLNAVKDGINKVIGFFFGLFESVWEMAKELFAKLKGESTRSIGEALSAGMSAALDRDYIGAIGDLASKAADKIRSFASGLTSVAQEDGKTKPEKDPWAELINNADRRLNSMKADQQALSMTAYEASKLRYETEMLNEAQQKNINLTPEMRRTITDLATTMATTELETNKLTQAMDFSKEVGRGFISDLKQGLRQGEGIWGSFANAAISALDRIMDKMLDLGVDMLFDGFKASSTGSDFFGSISSWLFNAKGNAFNSNGVTAFAKGGAFTNGVYNNPTMFTFGSGGSFGVMGEAGPEAVMPLHRGANGSLGVKAEITGSSQPIINIYNNTNSQATVQQRQTANGVEIDVMIDEIVGQKLGEQGTITNRSLNTYNSRRLIKR